MSDTPQVLLQHHLEKLRLPTFHSEYDKLARQCATENKDHIQYLLRLCELELIERERRIKAARFPATKSLPSRGLHANHCRATDQLRLQGHPVAEQGSDHAVGAVRVRGSPPECHRPGAERS